MQTRYRHKRLTVRHLATISAWLAGVVLLPGPARADLAGKLQARTVKYERASGARVGLRILDLRTDRVLLDRRASAAFVPASNQKLVASAVAIAKLGRDYEFRTVLAYHDGNLYLVGSGDPTLGDPVLAEKNDTSIYAVLDRWARRTRRQVGPVIRGNLVCLSTPPGNDGHWQHPDWSRADRARWYGAPVASLNFHDNCYDATFALRGGRVLPRIRPTSRFIRVIDRTRMGNRQIWSLRSDAEESTVVIRGTVKTATNEPFSSPAKTPPLLLGRVLADRLARAGVSLKGQIVHKPVPTRRFEDALIVAVSRTPLADVLARANKNSLNLAAECLLLRAGNGAWQDSAKAAEAILARRYGVQKAQATIRDGSGLSGKNRLSPTAMVKILQSLADSPAAGIFLASLPISGTDGSLDDRLTKPPYRGRVRAKTGYIYGVCCLSGYVLDAEGKPALAFSILVNDVPGGKAWVAKNLQDDLCRLLVDHLDG